MKFPIGNILRGPDRSMEASQELCLLSEAEKFRRLAALAWDKQTIYPKSEYRAGSSSGQCGVTNFGFGLWLSRLRIASVEQMFFEEGGIVAADGSLVGGDHTWLRVDAVDDGYTHSDLSMRFDLAGDQFADIDAPEVVQYDDYFDPDPQTSSGNRVYQAKSVTRFAEYDTSRFNGRLDRFMDKVCRFDYLV